MPQPKFEIQMLHDRVMVRILKDEEERRSSGGLVIPDTVEMATRLAWGEVFGVGNHVRMVKSGDRVLFSPEDRHEVEIQGQVYIVLRERDIHAIANERPEHGTGLYL